MSDATSWRWRRLILPLVVLAVTLPNLLRGSLSEAWPIWRGMMLSLLPVVAGAALVAAAAAGFVAWRRRRHDA